MRHRQNKYGYKMMNSWDIVHVICFHMHNTYMHVCVNFELSNTNISGVIDISENKFGFQMNTWDFVQTIVTEWISLKLNISTSTLFLSFEINLALF